MMRYINLLIILLLFSCSNNNKIKNIKSFLIENGVYAENSTILINDNNKLDIYYSDESKLTIKKVTDPFSNISIEYIDQIDTLDRLNPDFGKFFIRNKSEILYLDYETNNKIIFKHLTKSKKSDRYLLNVLNIQNCKDFFYNEKDDNIFFVDSKDNKLKVYDFSTASSSVIFENFENFDDFTLFVKNDSYFVSYRTEDKNLFQIEFKRKDGVYYFIGKKLIYNNVIRYKYFEFQNKIYILFFDEKKLLGIIDGKNIIKIGYFNYVNSFDVLTVGKKYYIFLSIVEKGKKDLFYSLNMIEVVNNNFREFVLDSNNNIILNINSIFFNNELNLLTAGNEVKLYLINDIDRIK